MNFYVILGVSPDASANDIKRAYTRLARRYHPGINPGDRAAESMYQRVSEAYETLIDPSRRRQYDAGGAGAPVEHASATFTFAEFDFSSPRTGPQASTFTELFADVLHPLASGGDRRAEAGADIHVTVTVSFADTVHGIERQVLVTRQVICGACAGAGHVAVTEGQCRQCRGGGQVQWARGHMVFSKVCTGCRGTGRLSSLQCGVCGGQGRGVRGEAIAVRVPPGIIDGTTMRVPEAGHAGRNGGRTGDLYATVRVQPHAFLRRDGDDLVCPLPVAVHEAALGAQIEAPTLDGPVTLRIPPGTPSGARLRAAGRGMPTADGARGDLLFDVLIVLPPVLDDRSRELLREFARLNPANVREAFAHDSGA